MVKKGKRKDDVSIVKKGKNGVGFKRRKRVCRSPEKKYLRLPSKREGKKGKETRFSLPGVGTRRKKGEEGDATTSPGESQVPFCICVRKKRGHGGPQIGSL